MTDQSDQPSPSDRPSDRINIRGASSPEISALLAATGTDSMRLQRIPELITTGDAPKANNKLGSRHTTTLQRMLSERDRQILQFVRTHKYATTGHLQRLYFARHATQEAGTRACTRVLGRLRQHRFLYRLQRPVGGIRGGSSAYIWGLDVAGDRSTRQSTSATNRVRQAEPSSTFLTHTLAITELHVQLHEAAAVGQFELVDAVTEPENWRTFNTLRGERTMLKPDLSVVTANSDYEDLWFIEIDLGNESIQSAILRKCRRYQTYYDTGLEQQQTGTFPIVAWLMHTAARVELLRATINHDPALDSRLFQVYLASDFVPSLQTGDSSTDGPDAPH